VVYVRLEEVEGEQTLQYFKGELKDLKENIEKNLSSIERNTDIDNVKYKVGRLITFYEQEKDLANSETAGWIFNTKYDRKEK